MQRRWSVTADLNQKLVCLSSDISAGDVFSTSFGVRKVNEHTQSTVSLREYRLRQFLPMSRRDCTRLHSGLCLTGGRVVVTS